MGVGGVQELPTGIEITVPAPRHTLMMVALGVWLAGWTIAEVQSVGQPLAGTAEEGTGPLLLWLA